MSDAVETRHQGASIQSPLDGERSAFGFATRAIHSGQEADSATGAVTVPIYQTSTFLSPGVGQLGAYEYSRTGNPTRHALEEAMAAVEEGTDGIAYASGMAAATSVLHLLKAGDHIVAGEDLYGGLYRLMDRVYSHFGLTVDYVDLSREDALASAMRPNTRVVWMETPTNPLLSVVDIARVAEVAHHGGALLAVDNTFASPYLQRPLTLGADIVVHSTTKYVGGHSDVVGGMVIVRDASLAERLHFDQNAAGAIPGPFDSWLVLRGLKTLAVRMDRHCENAREVAAVLKDHPSVERVYYPGLPEHPAHALAKRQMRDMGGMVSFVVRPRGGETEREAAIRVVSQLRVFTLAESLGGVESLVCHPATMTHAAVPEASRRARGITDNLVRLSVGIETAADLRSDLETALR